MNISPESLIYGRNPIKEALGSNRLKKVYVATGFQDKSVLEKLENNHIPYLFVSTKELDALCKGVHQGIAAEIKPYQYISLDELIIKGRKLDKKIIVLLDGINDPQNLGAILRSADVFGAVGVVIPKHNQVPLNFTVAKTSAGAINYIPVALVSNLNNAIRTLKDEGYWVVSTDGSATINYQDLKYDFPTAVVIGSEGNGVSSLVLKNSDYIVKIPQYGHVNSLNASVAAGILLAKIRN